MNDESPPQPVFIGGTLADHLLFVAALYRFQHHTLRLAAVHCVTWSVMHVALHAIAFALCGPVGPVLFGLAVTSWAVRLDVAVGLVFGLMTVCYARVAMILVPYLGMRPGVVVALSLATIALAIVAEATSHVVLQGYPPRPPKRAVTSLAASHKKAFVPYFVVVFGLFFLTLDLAMRVLGHRQGLHRRANVVASGWHEEALDGASRDSLEAKLHRRALVELGSRGQTSIVL